MVVGSEVEETMNTALKIINDIESNHGYAVVAGGENSGSLRSSLSNADYGGSAERSVLERLAYAPDGNSSDNAEKLKRGAKRASSAGGDIKQILQQLEELIISDDWINKETKGRGESPNSPYPDSPKKRGNLVNYRLSELERTLVSSSSLKAYISLLGTHHRQCIASWLYGSTSQTLSTLFRTPNNNLFCSEHGSTLSNSIKTGIGHAVRLALHDTYGSDYLTKGWRAFLEKGPPVVYVSPAFHIDLTSYLSTQHLIGDIVILKKSDGDLADVEGRIDHIAFEKQLDDDIGVGKKPLIVIGVVGSPVLGQNDIISRLLEIRKSKPRFWIHVVGQGLAALCLKEPSELLVHVLSQVDSFTIPLGSWLGIPTAPVITLHRSVDDCMPLYHEKLDALPWWIACQHLTVSGITDAIENAYFLSKVMLRGLAAFPQIEVLGVKNSIEFANRVYKGTYTPLTVLIFKYKYPDLEEIKKKKIPIANSPSSSEILTNNSIYSKNVTDELASSCSTVCNDDIDKLAEYADSLNIWLSQGLITNCRELGLQMVTLADTHYSAFRFSPIESAAC